MHTTPEILAFLEEVQFAPVLARGSARCRRRVKLAWARMRVLPPESVILYCIHAANPDVPNRAAANDELFAERFLTFRELLPALQARFPSLWPQDAADVPVGPLSSSSI